MISFVMLTLCNLPNSILSKIGSDGYENDPCLRLTDFKINGDWYAYNANDVDWSSVLAGSRTTATNLEWRITQNQCKKNETIRSGYYYKAGIFCDTFDNDEQSNMASGTKYDLDCCPNLWVPLISIPIQDQADLTNIYYVTSDLDLIICAAFERIDVNGITYIDIEFNQYINDTFIDPISCNPKWKCLYPMRTDLDLQISFEIDTNITQNVVTVYQWNSSQTQYVTLRRESMLSAINSYYYKSTDGAVEASINNGQIQSSSFGFICDDKNFNPTTNAQDCPTMNNKGTFFESCIDLKTLNINSVNFTSIIIKSRASLNGAYKDTSGVLYHTFEGPPTYPSLCTHAPTSQPTDTTSDPSTVPSIAPTTTTPTTSIPTINPSIYPTIYPSKYPTISPTLSPPTNSPSYSSVTTTTDIPTFSPTFGIYIAPKWETCIEIFSIFDIGVTGVISIDYDLKRKKLRIRLQGPSNTWFAIGFGRHYMYNTYTITVSGESNNIQTMQRILGNHTMGTVINNTFADINSSDIGITRIVSIIRDWKVNEYENVYDFTDFFECKVRKIPIIWARGVSLNFGSHGNYKGASLELFSCICDPTNSPTIAPTDIPTKQPTTEKPTKNPTLAVDETDSGNYAQLLFNIIILPLFLFLL